MCLLNVLFENSVQCTMYALICCTIGRAIAGTTDTPTNISYEPEPQEVEIQFILGEIKHYLSDEVNGKNSSFMIFFVIIISII